MAVGTGDAANSLPKNFRYTHSALPKMMMNVFESIPAAPTSHLYTYFYNIDCTLNDIRGIFHREPTVFIVVFTS